MPKKKQPFMCFVNHMRSSDPANRGLSIPDLVNKYGETWKNMSAEERKPYEEESKGLRVTRPIYTSQGKNLSVEQEELRAAEEYEEYLKQLVVSLVFEDKNIDNLKKKSFFFASFNVLVKTREDKKYYPNEIGIVEYSIAKGILNSFHEFIDPGDIPMGYARIAKEHSEQYTKIPMNNFGQARGSQKFEDGSRNKQARTDDLADLVLEIVQMLDRSKLTSKPDGTEQYIVFCREDQIEQVKGCFKFLCEQSEEFAQVSGRFIVLDIVRLLMVLASRCGKKRPYGICEGDLTRSTYNYSPDTNCAFHDEMDTYYCALGLAKRYCYMLSDVLCQMYDVKPTDKHYPPEPETNFEVKDVKGFGFEWKPPMKRYFKSLAEEESNSFDNVSSSIRPPRDFPSEVRGPNAAAGPSRVPDIPIKEEKSVPSGHVLGIGRGVRVPQQKSNF